MKRGLLVVGFLMLALRLGACDIKFEIVGDKKTGFKAGDEVVLTVTVELSHRNCPLEIKETKFSYEGLKVVSATEWKEVQPGTYKRQVKVLITESTKKPRLTLSRECHKEGGYGAFVFEKS